jgi:hypothetical protein
LFLEKLVEDSSHTEYLFQAKIDGKFYCCVTILTPYSAIIPLHTVLPQEGSPIPEEFSIFNAKNEEFSVSMQKMRSFPRSLGPNFEINEIITY